jgi:hypothetical protein
MDGTADSDFGAGAEIKEAAGGASTKAEVVEHLRGGYVELHIVVGRIEQNITGCLNIAEHKNILRSHFKVCGVELDAGSVVLNRDRVAGEFDAGDDACSERIARSPLP